MKKLSFLIIIFAIIGMLLSSAYSASKDYDDAFEDTPRRESKCGLLKNIFIGALLLFSPIPVQSQSVISRNEPCYLGIGSRDMQHVRQIAYGQCGNLPYRGGPYQNISMAMSFQCTPNTQCSEVDIKRISLCSKNYDVHYRNWLKWDYNYSSANPVHCSECFALSSFYLRDDFQIAFDNYMSTGLCPQPPE